MGQRIVQLMEGDEVLEPPVIRADHGSAACFQPATSATGLQHDSFATPPDDPEILTDTTDAVGRCHDSAGGGIELFTGDVGVIDSPLEFDLLIAAASAAPAEILPQKDARQDGYLLFFGATVANGRQRVKAETHRQIHYPNKC